MKNKSLKLGFTYLFRQHIGGKESSGNILKLVKSESERERTKSLIEDILRWADDGGQMIEIGNAIKE